MAPDKDGGNTIGSIIGYPGSPKPKPEPKEMDMMAEGGEAGMDDDKAIMDQVAMEAMQAIESKDKEGFLNALHVLVASIVDEMSGGMESKERE